MAQTWSYADVRPIDEWDDGLNAFRKACKDNWGYRAEAAGYKLKKGADLVETVVPLWQNSAGDYTELNTGGDPVARKLVITGVVTRRKKK